MRSEGCGTIAPRPTKLALTRCELQQLADEAIRRAQYRGYSGGNSKWKRGLTGSEAITGIGIIESSVVPCLRGLVGEYATARFINSRLHKQLVSVDLRLLPGGDNGIDLAMVGITVQIKTRKRGPASLVRRITDKKNIVPVLTSAFIFCQWANGYSAELLGWAWAADLIATCVIEESLVAEHWNLRVEDSSLQPMLSFVSEIQSRIED